MSIIGVSNPVGTGKGLNYIGNHCYGNSGIGSPGTGGDFLALSFSCASNNYIRAKLYITYDADDLGAGEQLGYKVELDGELIVFSRREATTTDIVDNPLPHKVEFLIPPASKVNITGFSNSSGVNMTFILTGRVY